MPYSRKLVPRGSDLDFYFSYHNWGDSAPHIYREDKLDDVPNHNGFRVRYVWAKVANNALSDY